MLDGWPLQLETLGISKYIQSNFSFINPIFSGTTCQHDSRVQSRRRSSIWSSASISPTTSTSRPIQPSRMALKTSSSCSLFQKSSSQGHGLLLKGFFRETPSLPTTRIFSLECWGMRVRRCGGRQFSISGKEISWTLLPSEFHFSLFKVSKGGVWHHRPSSTVQTTYHQFRGSYLHRDDRLDRPKDWAPPYHGPHWAWATWDYRETSCLATIPLSHLGCREACSSCDRVCSPQYWPSESTQAIYHSSTCLSLS